MRSQIEQNIRKLGKPGKSKNAIPSRGDFLWPSLISAIMLLVILDVSQPWMSDITRNHKNGCHGSTIKHRDCAVFENCNTTKFGSIFDFNMSLAILDDLTWIKSNFMWVESNFVLVKSNLHLLNQTLISCKG